MADAVGGARSAPERLGPDAGDCAVAAAERLRRPVLGGEPPSRDGTASGPEREQAEGGENWRGLLLPLAQAQDALARLEAAAALASEPVRDGLAARLALREAAGWLAHNGAWVSETDLALRAAGLVGAWGIAGHAGRLAHAMPATAAACASGTAGHGAAPGDVPDDRLVGHALQLAHHWRALAEPEAALVGGDGDPEWDGLRCALAGLGRGGPMDDEWRGWLAVIGDDEGLPSLLHAARLARAWQQERAAGDDRGDLLSPATLFLAASIWRGRRLDGLPLPVWSAPPAMLHTLALKGAAADATEWTAGLLAITVEAARRAHGELRRLQDAERRGLALAAAGTARSRLPAALDAALRLPVLTSGTLAARAGISTRASLALVGRLVKGGVLREATGRGAWRAYALAA